MKVRILAATFVLIVLPSTSSAQFYGNLSITPPGCTKIGQCTLQAPLRFQDSQGLVWEAMKGLVTDGASIPGVFQPLIGDPFDEKFIKAAIIHDHYCDRHVRSWRVTHRAFYDALLSQGVSVAKAKTMYLGVVVGGPKWIKLIPGNDCGKKCVNAVKSTMGVSGFRSRPADYSLPALQATLQETLTQLQDDSNKLSLEQLDALARQLRPDDFYFNNGDAIVVSGPHAVE